MFLGYLTYPLLCSGLVCLFIWLGVDIQPMSGILMEPFHIISTQRSTMEHPAVIAFQLLCVLTRAFITS